MPIREFLQLWFPTNMDNEYVNIFHPDNKMPDNFDSFLTNPDPEAKLDALITQYGDVNTALKQLNLLMRHNYINNIDVAKIRKVAKSKYKI